MNRYLVDVRPPHERASASPAGLKAKGGPTSPAQTERPPAAPDQVSPPAQGTLRSDQLWFVRAVMTPESAPAAVTDDDASQTLTPGPHLSALGRLEIYRRGYHARLIECLADDYGVLRHALGEGPFEDLCRAYVARHPSGGPNLNFFGRNMESFCRGDAPLPLAVRPLAADLAALEWAIVEVIHAPSSPALTLGGLREIPLSTWATARLIPNSACRLLRFASPVNEYFQAVREGQDPPLPSACSSATVIYRSGETVWRMDLSVPMFEVLSSLVAGQALATSLAAAEASLGPVDEEEAAKRVVGWFREWVGSGLFVRVELD